MCKRLCSESVSKLRINIRILHCNSVRAAQTPPKGSVLPRSVWDHCLCLHWALGHRTGLSWSTSLLCSGIFQQLHCNGPMLETTEQHQAPALVLDPALSACVSVPGILQEFALCRLKEKEEQQKRSGEEQSGREGEKEDESLCNYSLTSCKTQAEEPDLVIAVSNPKFFCAFSLLAASPSACNSFQPAHRDRLCPKEPAQLQQPNPTAPTAKALASWAQVALLQNNRVLAEPNPSKARDALTLRIQKEIPPTTKIYTTPPTRPDITRLYRASGSKHNS